ncbi:hypothetical protein COS31_00655 [Candidatus Roizmanbacteria bacterium CG02_land_8_20_14_3_00_36_15]|uniref:Uncharacterized protein n=2 Tax=Candidatus Roizmaniibacteriota TaxID=1752723 RepID=A0A2M8KMT9_9BACT|nr:MAG: hypothetical protein COS51_00575 [Candidatus Roizmanbacteria bacterium CG03_land_8_20_14_0_80_36_21]PIV38191.1 MAG: hypothetical protein COS31_00655 [Candidatus Roizmanbacteria bacterium CG02_land_8_20_14_3_00_36_15]PIY70003.1 MAG: hypothetical protein COY89_03515 [Candidatus Roizmanbacteria bacterium CG_4_10_14_0_8_um_filter_36_36]PJA52520.1 MAG: hypothetical protein CO166_05395 [Candidatus Roizmanbacteria bacterium CG_4_9_14_3_um_filter_36_11]PJC81978.1 MAG: hypothetical protein CO007
MHRLDVYVNFFTNIAVAWFTAGVISSFFISNNRGSVLYFLIFGILGSYICLQIAVRLFEEKNARQY